MNLPACLQWLFVFGKLNELDAFCSLRGTTRGGGLANAVTLITDRRSTGFFHVIRTRTTVISQLEG